MHSESKVMPGVGYWKCTKAGKKSAKCKARITMSGNNVLATGHEHICKDIGEPEEYSILKVSE